MNKNNKVNGLIDGVVYNEEEEKKLHHSEDENFMSKIAQLLVYPDLDE